MPMHPINSSACGPAGRGGAGRGGRAVVQRGVACGRVSACIYRICRAHPMGSPSGSARQRIIGAVQRHHSTRHGNSTKFAERTPPGRNRKSPGVTSKNIFMIIIF